LLCTTLLFCCLCFSSSIASWTWSQSLAYEYLYYAYAAYCPESELQSWSCSWCKEAPVADFTPYAFPDDSKINGFGYVGYHNENQTIVISFRGTQEDSLENWITDLESMNLVAYKNMSGIEVGEGFYDEWNDLKSQVLDAVYQLNQTYPKYNIWVTGHSLGAAISILCAVELAQLGYSSSRIHVYNYGLPRVGNENFSDFYRTLVPNTFRVVNGHDVVPHLPPMDLGFYHVPTEVWENPGETLTFKVCNGSGEDPTCSDSQYLDLSIFDHLHYLNLTEACT